MVTPKKQLGQHWLKDKAALNAIVDAAEVKPGEVVLEIGPGLGDLTQVLINRGAAITAVEFDEALAVSLASRINDPDKLLSVENKDIMHYNLGSLPKDYKVVANIPYYLTSGLIRLLAETDNPPYRAVILVQKEVAQRVAAKPGAMSILSVTAQVYFKASLGLIVPAKLFMPPPKVDSQVLILDRRSKPLFGSQDPKELFRLVKAGFSERRKKLRSSLSGGLQISKQEAEKLLESAGIDPNLRAQNLSLADWIALSSGIYF
jgi:16S rRNA (adenine1518-N6/adenine1519-N6)-dimethyltransferase